MKANEIQIGDWLYSIIDRYDHVEKKLCKVTGIRTDCDAPLIQCDDTDVWYHLDSYEPIPLTPEVLEKNGFRIVFDGELHVSYFQDIESFHTEVKVDKIGIYQKLSMIDGLGNGVSIVECKYVHQLQHALRLCGIEKEIIL